MSSHLSEAHETSPFWRCCTSVLWPFVRVVLRLTHPAVRNQQQILQLAAHQLVFHMPMPSLLLDVRHCAEADLESTDDASQSAKAESAIRGDAELQHRRKPMLPLLLIDGIYDAVIKALSAWVLVRLLVSLGSNTKRTNWPAEYASSPMSQTLISRGRGSTHCESCPVADSSDVSSLRLNAVL